MTPHDQKLAKLIAEKRRASGLKQEELAERLDMCPTNLSRIENAQVSINVEMLRKIALELNTTPSQLLLEAGL